MNPKLNREWHEAHQLPRSSTIDERIRWHMEHHEVCNCREVPASVLAEIEKRGGDISALTGARR